MIHDLDSRWTSNVTLCYLTITDTNKCMPCKYQKSQLRHCPAHLPDFILDIVRWLTMPHSIVIKSNGSVNLNVNVLLSMHIYIYQGWVISREFVPILLHCSTSAELTWQRGGGKNRNRQEIVLSPPLFSPTDSPDINHSARIEKWRCCPLFVTTSREVFDKEN